MSSDLNDSVDSGNTNDRDSSSVSSHGEINHSKQPFFNFFSNPFQSGYTQQFDLDTMDSNQLSPSSPLSSLPIETPKEDPKEKQTRLHQTISSLIHPSLTSLGGFFLTWLSPFEHYASLYELTLNDIPKLQSCLNTIDSAPIFYKNFTQTVKQRQFTASTCMEQRQYNILNEINENNIHTVAPSNTHGNAFSELEKMDNQNTFSNEPQHKSAVVFGPYIMPWDITSANALQILPPLPETPKTSEIGHQPHFSQKTSTSNQIEQQKLELQKQKQQQKQQNSFVSHPAAIKLSTLSYDNLSSYQANLFKQQTQKEEEAKKKAIKAAAAGEISDSSNVLPRDTLSTSLDTDLLTSTIILNDVRTTFTNPKEETPHMSGVIFSTFRPLILILIFAELTTYIGNLIQPYTIKLLFAYFNRYKADENSVGTGEGIFLASLIGILSLSTSLSLLFRQHYIAHFAAPATASILSALFTKVLRIAPCAITNDPQVNIGFIMNLVSTDSNVLLNGMFRILQIISSPIAIGICLLLMYLDFGSSTFVLFILLILLLPYQIGLGWFRRRLEEHYNTLSDIRAQYAINMLHAIRIVKIYGWEHHLEAEMNVLRERELRQLTKVAAITHFSDMFAHLYPMFLNFITITIYVTYSTDLSPEKVVLLISYLSSIYVPLQSMGEAIAGFFRMRLSLQRITDFLKKEEVPVIQYQLEQFLRHSCVNTSAASNQTLSQDKQNDHYTVDPMQLHGHYNVNGSNSMKNGITSDVEGGNEKLPFSHSFETVNKTAISISSYSTLNNTQQPNRLSLIPEGEEDILTPNNVSNNVNQSDENTTTSIILDQEKDIALSLANIDCYWSSFDTIPWQLPILSGIDIAIEKGHIIGLISPQAAGKTAFLQSIIGELYPQPHKIQGRLNAIQNLPLPAFSLGDPVENSQPTFNWVNHHFSFNNYLEVIPHSLIHINSNIAYCPQHPWILTATVRDNICLDQPFDQAKFLKVVEAAALGPDLSILPQADLSIASNDNLSGGQRARICFARLLYHSHCADIFLLDDIMAAVDGLVARTMFYKGIKDILKGKTVILALNSHYDYLQECDKVIVLHPTTNNLNPSHTHITTDVSQTSSIPISAQDCHLRSNVCQDDDIQLGIDPDPNNTNEKNKQSDQYWNKLSHLDDIDVSIHSTTRSTHTDYLTNDLHIITAKNCTKDLPFRSDMINSTVFSKLNDTYWLSLYQYIFKTQSNIIHQLKRTQDVKLMLKQSQKRSIVGIQNKQWSDRGKNDTDDAHQGLSDENIRSDDVDINYSHDNNNDNHNGLSSKDSLEKKIGNYLQQAQNDSPNTASNPIFGFRPPSTVLYYGEFAGLLALDIELLRSVTFSSHNSTSVEQAQLDATKVGQINAQLELQQQEKLLEKVETTVIHTIANSPIANSPIANIPIANTPTVSHAINDSNNNNDAYLFFTPTNTPTNTPTHALALPSVPDLNDISDTINTNTSQPTQDLSETIEATTPQTQTQTQTTTPQTPSMANAEIPLRIYRYYFQGSFTLFGLVMIILSLSLSTIGSQFFRTTYDIILLRWSEDEQNGLTVFDRSSWITFSALCMTFSILGFIGQSITFLVIWINGSRHVFSTAIHKVLYTTIPYLDTISIGTIINKVAGKDLNNVDTMLPDYLLFLIQQGFVLIGILGLSMYSSFVYILPIIPMIFLILQRRPAYHVTSTQLQRLQSAATSPMYTLFGSVIHGTSSIRAYGFQQQFTLQFHKLINNWLQIRITALQIDNRFGWFINALSTVYVFVIVLGVILGRQYFDLDLSMLAISYIFRLVWLAQFVIRFYVQATQNLTAVQRIELLNDIPQESELGTSDEVKALLYKQMKIHFSNRTYNKQNKLVSPQESLPQSPTQKKTYQQRISHELHYWPWHGHISFKNVTVRYREDLPVVLNNLSFDILPGQKVGIVGRTGSGKSTLLQLFPRTLIPMSGSITIDEIDISSLGISDVRKRIAIIPQTPTLFEGTIRSNLDPFQHYNDDQMWFVLDLVGLKTKAIEMENGLDSVVSEGGNNLSASEQQSFCIARALLSQYQGNGTTPVDTNAHIQNSPMSSNQPAATDEYEYSRATLLIGDEITAMVPDDSAILNAISTVFSSATTLMIAHRLLSIIDCDVVLVLRPLTQDDIDNGVSSLMEFEHPFLLLNKPTSTFYRMCAQNGVEQFNKLYSLSKASFMKKNKGQHLRINTTSSVAAPVNTTSSAAAPVTIHSKYDQNISTLHLQLNDDVNNNDNDNDNPQHWNQQPSEPAPGSIPSPLTSPNPFRSTFDE